MPCAASGRATEALETPLAESADPVDVARGYQRLYPFQILYIADLDGIEGRARTSSCISRQRRLGTAKSGWMMEAWTCRMRRPNASAMCSGRDRCPTAFRRTRKNRVIGSCRSIFAAISFEVRGAFWTMRMRGPIASLS